MDFKRSSGGLLIPVSQILAGGRFDIEHVRGGEVIDEFSTNNIVTNEGLNHILNTTFNGGTQITTWYLGLFEGNYTPVSTVTAATITAASTESTAYDEAARQEFMEALSTAQSTTNVANKATFTMSASKTLYGAFLVSASAKSATSGTLLSAARFGAAKTVVDDDQLLVTYTFNIASV